METRFTTAEGFVKSAKFVGVPSRVKRVAKILDVQPHTHAGGLGLAIHIDEYDRVTMAMLEAACVDWTTTRFFS